jgi:putative adhesin
MFRNPRHPVSLAAFAAAALFVSLAVPRPAAAGEPREEKFEKAYELTGIDKVRVQNVNGPVRLEAWDKDYLRVTAIKKGKGSRAEEILKETEIRVSKKGSLIDIETILPKRDRVFGLFYWGNGHDVEVSYELLLPALMAVDVETVNGRITAEHRTGELSLNTVNGSVHVDNHRGPLHVNTVNGSVEVTFDGNAKATDLETVNGSVTVACARESSIRYDLQTVNGRIESDFVDVASKGRHGPREARGEINGGKEKVAVETVNGEVRLQAGKQ